MKQLLILAGGKGTRLKSVTGDLPKPLAPVGGIPVLEHQVRQAASHGFNEILFLTSYRSEMIVDHFGDGSRFGVVFKYVVDENPLGTAGAVLAALEHLDDDFLLLYGDTMHDVDLRAFADFHLARPQAAACLLIHPNDHPQDSDLVEINGEFQIRRFHGYPHPAGLHARNLVNAGLYSLSSKALKKFVESPIPLDFAKNLFPEMLRSGECLFGYPSREYIKDMGTPERLAKVNRDHDSGKIKRLNRNNSLPAIFLDRDGTVIAHKPFLNRLEDVRLLPGAAKAIRAINDAGYLAVLVTNQPVIARGECTVDELECIHGFTEELLAEESKAFFDAIYYCPHHPDAGFEGEVPELKTTCECRKPGIGMIQQAAADLNIDLANSWIIGDSIRDWQTGVRAGLTPLFVNSGEEQGAEHTSVPQGSVFSGLSQAVTYALEHNSKNRE